MACSPNILFTFCSSLSSACAVIFAVTLHVAPNITTLSSIIDRLLQASKHFLLILAVGLPCQIMLACMLQPYDQVITV